jgi:hypothetical protein
MWLQCIHNPNSANYRGYQDVATPVTAMLAAIAGLDQTVFLVMVMLMVTCLAISSKIKTTGKINGL